MLNRRTFLASAAAAVGLPVRARKVPGLKIGVMDGVLRLSSNPEACAVAKRLSLEGVQVTLGRPANGRLPLEDPELQARWAGASKEHGVPLDATYIDVLHADCLKNNVAARDWIRRGIGITRKLDAKILMTVFFGRCAVENKTELETVADAFRELAPEAAKANVILGFENLLSAEDNLRVWDRVASPAFKIFYDVGNSTGRGYDVPKEIRQLGKDRICQFHFKDGQSYLGEGKVDFRPILDAIGDIGFTGFANLETANPSGNIEADTSRNLGYLRGLMA
jgi:sugar phosphate isomerase/epimerase